MTGSGSGDLHFTNDISGTGGVTKTGTGEMRLSGNNTYTGQLVVNAGQVTLASSTAAGAPGGGVFVNSNAVLAIDGNLAITGEPLTIDSTAPVQLKVLSGGSYWDNPITLNQNTTINVAAGAGLDIYFGLSGSGALTKKGAGTLQMLGSVGTTDTNTITVAEGTLILNTTPSVQAIVGPLIIGDGVGGADADVVRLARVRQIANTVPVTINSSGLLDLNGLSDAFGALFGNGHVNLNGGIMEVLNYAGETSTFDGVIRGAGDVYKEGTGSLTLNGNNTYTGTTVLFASVATPGGTLLVNGSQPQSPVAISNGCTLGGSGTVGSITVSPGGTVSPGNSAGILTSSGVSFSAGSVFRVELNGPAPGTGYDQLSVQSGSVQLNGATLNATLGFQSPSNSTFTIINKVSGNQINGTFVGLPQNATLYISGIPFRISYNGGTGNDVVLTQLQVPPALTSLRVSGNNLAFSWPAQYAGFTLEANTNLAVSLWLPVSPAPVITGPNYVVTNGLIGPQKFFRLRSP